MAMTSNDEVVPSVHEHCEGNGENELCQSVVQRWSYAFPLEIDYLTPLSSWNYYDLDYKGDAGSEEADSVTADGRNGDLTEELAYNGTHSKIYYVTPEELFDAEEGSSDPADTGASVVGVLDKNGTMRAVRSSGMRIFLPNIPGVGELRQRYPVMPIYGEGQTVMKELEALKDIVLNPGGYNWALRTGDRHETENGMTLLLGPSDDNHTHLVFLRRDDVWSLNLGKHLWINTEISDGHRHRLLLSAEGNGRNTSYIWEEMMPYENHEQELTKVTEDD